MMTSLHKAISNNHVDIVQLLLVHSEFNVNAQDKYGFTALILAVDLGNVEMVKLLTESPRVDVNLLEGNCTTALMIACWHGFSEVTAEILRREDCNVNLGGNSVAAALGLACMQGELDIVKMLLEKKEIDINTQTVNGVTPFTLSLVRSHDEISKILLNRPDLKLNYEDIALEKGIVHPLHVAAANGQVEIVKKLIRFGCDVDRMISDSYTAIPITMVKCSDTEKVVKIINTLLEAGCRPTMENVKMAIFKVPELQQILLVEVRKPLSLMKLSRKSVLRNLRRMSFGKNVQPLLLGLKNEIPDTLLEYLRFQTR